MSAVLPFCSAMLGSTRPLASSSFTLPAHALTDQAPGRGSLLNPEGPSLPRGAWSLLSHRTGGAALRRRSSSEEASSEEEEEEEEAASLSTCMSGGGG